MQNSIYINDPAVIKYLTRLRLGLTDLNEQKFRQLSGLLKSIVFL